ALDAQELATLDDTFFDGAVAGDTSETHLRSWTPPPPVRGSAGDA
ncbi:MAG: hypothetical protein QOG64_897, partial [Acidimicrobiaceae bacterium]|nr:hypothetical protein [Acidimicrobiaceae bacterium]